MFVPQVQEDLLSLRDKLLTKGEKGNVDISALENAIQKTEEGLKVRICNVQSK